VKTENASRPFYDQFAWAFDLLIDRPVQKECHAIAAWLVERGVVPGASVLDAGCGTGRYAIELGRRGYVVRGIDMSMHLIEEANRSLGSASPQVSFAVGDILTLPASRYDAILCRGVLNDLVNEDERSLAFASFSRALRKGGALVLDVREWDATAARKSREPLFRKRVDTDRGKLTFTSITELDVPTRRLLVKEQHILMLRVGDIGPANGVVNPRGLEPTSRCEGPRSQPAQDRQDIQLHEPLGVSYRSRRVEA
jgi:SAM-dependent methyltransferase